MTDSDILDALQEKELEVDHGNLIAGPFISDGRVRIYCPETHDVRGEGDTLQEAFDNVFRFN